MDIIVALKVLETSQSVQVKVCEQDSYGYYSSLTCPPRAYQRLAV